MARILQLQPILNPVKIPHLSLLLPCLYLTLASHGQTPDTLELSTLQQTQQLAARNNPTQAIYQQQIRQARFNYKASRSFLYPSITAGFDGTDNLSLAVTPVPGAIFGNPGATIFAKFGKNYVYNTGLTLNKDLLNWAAVTQMRIAQKNSELVAQQKDAFVQSLKEQLARLYYSVLIARSALRINERDRALADSVLELSQQRLAQGTTDLLTVNTAAINRNTIAQNQAQSQQLIDQGIENLKILLGEKPSTELKLTEQLDADAMDFLSAQSLNTDKNLAVYQQQAVIAGMQSKAQKAAAYPRVSVTSFTGAQQFRDDFGMSFGNDAWSSYRYIDLSISIPLFTGFANTNKYRSAVTQKHIAELQWDAATQQSAINDRLLAKNYADYTVMVRSSLSSFKLYGQNVSLDQQKYEQGLVSLDVYMKTFQDYLTAENSYLNNLSQLLSLKSTFISRQ